MVIDNRAYETDNGLVMIDYREGRLVVARDFDFDNFRWTPIAAGVGAQSKRIEIFNGTEIVCVDADSITPTATAAMSQIFRKGFLLVGEIGETLAVIFTPNDWLTTM